MRAASINKTIDVLAALVVFIVPVVIWRIAVDPIDLVKGTFLWVLGVPLVALLAVRWAGGEKLRVPRASLGAFLVLIVAALIVTVTSMAPWISLFGQYQRYTGFLTICVGAGLACAISDSLVRGRSGQVYGAIVAAFVCVTGYGMVQEFGRDPLEWSASSFGKLVFSTLGNPNTASAWLSCTVPLLFGLLAAAGQLWIRVFLSVLLGLAAPMLGAFLSFQGQVAVLFALFVVAASLRRRDISVWGKTSLIVGFVGLAALPQMTSRHILFVVGPAWMLGALGLSLLKPSALIGRVNVVGRRTRIAIGLGLSSVALSGVLVFRTALSSGFSGGFLERGDFFRAAWGVWKSHPILGSGLETFGFVFGEFRPESHAVNLESSRTSSAHNIFLGMFSNGGLVLGVAYLIAMALIGFFAYRILRLTAFRSTVDAGVVGSWAAFQVVSLVSVEHVALFTLNFTLSGLITGRFMLLEPKTIEDSGKNRSPRIRRGHRGRLNARAVPVAASAAVVVILCCWQFTRPLRAANSAYNGLQAYYTRSDLGEAAEGLKNAITIAPWEPLYKLQYAETLAQQGETAGAASVASAAASQSFYQGGFASNLAKIVFDAGDIARGIEIMERAVEADPYAPSLIVNLATIKVIGAQQYLSRGETETARKQLTEALEIKPDLQIEGLAQLRATLGV